MSSMPFQTLLLQALSPLQKCEIERQPNVIDLIMHHVHAKEIQLSWAAFLPSKIALDVCCAAALLSGSVMS